MVARPYVYAKYCIQLAPFLAFVIYVIRFRLLSPGKIILMKKLRAGTIIVCPLASKSHNLIPYYWL